MPDLYLLCHPTELLKPSNTGQLLPGLLPVANWQCSTLTSPALAATGGAPASADSMMADSTNYSAVKQAINNTGWRCHQISWQRRSPDAGLMAALARGGAVLLYPSAHAHRIDFDQTIATQLQPGESVNTVIVLDATWQLAQKMYNQSPYLHDLTHWQACSAYQSAFALRRNQRVGAWCTAETVALLWQALGETELAAALWQAFHQFNQRPL